MKRAGHILAVLSTVLILFPAAPAVAADDDLIIHGSGFGHGIGMSQYGSYGRALDGQSYEDIIEAYYTGATVASMGTNGIPVLDNVMTNVKSDDGEATFTIIDNPGKSGVGNSKVTITRGIAASKQTEELGPGDSLTITDTKLWANRGCTVDFTIDGESSSWDKASCDITIYLADSTEEPDNLVQLDECRTLNCTFGWGEKLRTVDNFSTKRDYPDDYEGFDIIVEATLDDYTRGIAESIFSWGNTNDGKHALYTQAVAARSYAASYVTARDHEKQGCFCDVKNSSLYQVYAGWLGDRDKWENWDEAAAFTAGEVVHHDGAKDGIVRAFYSSSNGGASENNEDIWVHDAISWLRSIDDPWSTDPASSNPYAEWPPGGDQGIVVSTSVLKSKLDLDEVNSIDIVETYVSGTPSRIAVTGERGGSTVIVDEYLGNPIDGDLLASSSWYGLPGPHITGFNGDLPEPPPVTDTARWWGANRYGTAVAVSKANFSGGADAVVIATGLNYPDALAAASFAAQIDAPVLLVNGGSVPAVTSTEIGRLDPSKIYILGGTAAVPTSAENVLDDFAPVTRLAGANRYGTAVQISKQAHSGAVDTVYLAPGTSFVEALVAGPVAAASGDAILLVRPTDLPDSVANEIKRLNPSKIVVVGGGTIIDETVVDELSAYADSVISISGGNRYATSVLVSKHGYPSGADTVLIATGTIFPDALSGGGVAGDLNAPILLVEPDSLPSSVASELLRLDPLTVRILGGPAAISDGVVQEIIDLLD